LHGLVQRIERAPPWGFGSGSQDNKTDRNDNAPCSEDLSFTADLDAIAEARRFDDPTLDQGEWVTDIKEADWPFVEQHCKKCKYTIDIDDDKLHQPA